MKNVNTILFDLDGTLLSIDMKDFENYFVNSLLKAFDGFKDTKFVKTILEKPIKNTIQNDGSQTNKNVFLDSFKDILSKDEYIEVSSRFNNFYKNEYHSMEKAVKTEDTIPKSIDILKEKGYELVIATNPLFPFEAVKARVKWANLDIDDFKFVTSIETSSFAKPNINYYKEILDEIKKDPDECFMVGNDVLEDLVIRELGIKTFLINNHILNRHNLDYISDFEGDYNDYLKFVKSLPNIK